MGGFTREQYDALCEGIASGSTAISYGGKTVTYRSLDEMLKTARIIQKALGIVPNKASIVHLEYQRKL